MSFKAGSSLLPVRACGSQEDGRPSRARDQTCVGRGVSRAGLEFLLEAQVPGNSWHITDTSWKDNPPSRTEGLAQTCLLSSTVARGHRGSKPMTEELGGEEGEEEGGVPSSPHVGVPHCTRWSNAGLSSPATSVARARTELRLTRPMLALSHGVAAVRLVDASSSFQL